MYATLAGFMRTRRITKPLILFCSLAWALLFAFTQVFRSDLHFLTDTISSYFDGSYGHVLQVAYLCLTVGVLSLMGQEFKKLSVLWHFIMGVVALLIVVTLLTGPYYHSDDIVNRLHNFAGFLAFFAITAGQWMYSWVRKFWTVSLPVVQSTAFLVCLPLMQMYDLPLAVIEKFVMACIFIWSVSISVE